MQPRPISDHTQCKFRPVSNNSQQDQCDTVYGVQSCTVEITTYHTQALISCNCVSKVHIKGFLLSVMESESDRFLLCSIVPANSYLESQLQMNTGVGIYIPSVN